MSPIEADVDNKQTSKARFPIEAGSGLKLVARAQRGEETAFLSLYELHKTAVYTICFRLTGSAKDAEKVTQEAFLCVFRNILAFAEDCEFAKALHDLAIRRALAMREERALLKISKLIRQTKRLAWRVLD
jgi:DNA-directed RNA polymerase specialized sigma24 family protein